ncbi:MAG: extensin family protein [Polyangiales bacterium]
MRALAALALAAAVATAAGEVRAQTDAAVSDAVADAVADAVGDAGSAESVGEEGPLNPDEEHAAQRVMPDPDDPRDPLAEEAERAGATEGRETPSTPTLAMEIGALSGRACLRALARSHVAYERVRSGVPGIATPVTLTGPLHGVWLRGSGETAMRETMDCRLAVALVRFADMLRPLGVRGLRHISLYRAPSARELARGTAARHGVGLAADIAAFVMQDGTSFVVDRDFHGRMRRPVCGPAARVPNDGAARTLRTFFCEAARRGVFSILLSPNFNRAHHNHFHLEVSRRASWQFVR